MKTILIFTLTVLVLITNSQNAFSFGNNGNGQLGLGDLIQRNIPTLINSVNSVTQICFGQFQAFVLNSTNTFSMGENSDGRLGLGDTIQRIVPTNVPISNVKMVACGWSHTLAVQNTGLVWSTGNNGNGRLGLGDTTQRISFTQISSPTNIVYASAGDDFSLIVGSDGSIWSFGNNNYGQLGQGDNQQRVSPTQIVSLTGITKAAACMDGSAVVISNSAMYTFGNGNAGRLGLGNQNQVLIPTQVPGVSNVKDFSCGMCHVLYVVNEVLYGFGCANNGRLGLGSNLSNQLSPVNITTISGVTKVAAGDDFSIVITNQTKVFSFGGNEDGQLGQNSTSQLLVPTLIPTVKGVSTIATGYKSSILISNTNIYCFNKSASDPTVCYGFGYCNSTNQCICDSYSGYDPGTCAPLCFGIPSYNSGVCSGLGTCLDVDTCSCYTGYSGLNCDDPAIYNWRGLSGSWSNLTNWAVGPSAIGIALRLPRNTDSIYINQQGNYTLNYNQSYIPVFLSIGGPNTFANVVIMTSQFLNNTLIINNGSILTLTTNFTSLNLNLSGSGSILIQNNASLDLSINTMIVTPSITSYGVLNILNSVISFNNPILLYGSSFTHSGTLSFFSNFEFISNGILSLNSINQSGNTTISTSQKTIINSFNSVGQLVSLNGDFRFNQFSFNNSNNGTFNIKSSTTFSTISSITLSISSLIAEQKSTIYITPSASLFIQNIDFKDSSTFTASSTLQISSNNFMIETNCVMTFYQNTSLYGSNLSIGNGTILTFNDYSSLIFTNTTISSCILTSAMDSLFSNNNLVVDGSKLTFIGVFTLISSNLINLNSSDIEVTQSAYLNSQNLSLTNSNIYFNSNLNMSIINLSLQNSNMTQKSSFLLNPLFGSPELNNLLSIITCNLFSISGSNLQFSLTTFTCNNTQISDSILNFQSFIYSSGNLQLTQSYLTVTSNTMITSAQFLLMNSIISLSSMTLYSNLIQMNQTTFIITLPSIINSNYLFIYDQSNITFPSINLNIQSYSISNSNVTYQQNSILNSTQILITTSNIIHFSTSNFIVSSDFTIIQSTILFNLGATIISQSLEFLTSLISFNSDSYLQSTFFTCNSRLIFNIPALMNMKSINLVGGVLQFNRRVSFNSTTLLQGGTILLNSDTGNFIIGDITSTSFIFSYGTNVTFYLANNQNFNNVNIDSSGDFSFLPLNNGTIPIIKAYSSTFMFRPNINVNQMVGIDSSDSQIINNGFYTINADNTNQFIATIPFLNTNSLRIKGSSSTIYFTSQFTQQTIMLSFLTNFTVENNPTLIINGNLTIDKSNIYLTGNIQSDLVTITNSTIFFNGPLNITGNVQLSPTTLFIIVTRSGPLNDFLTISGNVNFGAFLYIKLDGTYLPQIGDQRAFMKFESSSPFKNRVLFIGAAYRNAMIVVQGNIASFEIIFSIGASTNQGYGCTYLGNSKILEYNIFPLEDKISMSMTVPFGASWSGFGFDINNISSLMMLGLNNQAFQAINHNLTLTKNYMTFIDISTTVANSLFNIGPLYRSLSVFLSYSVIRNQQDIFYADNYQTNVSLYVDSQGNTLVPVHDNVETYNFKVGKDNPVDCTNFLAPTRAEIYSLYSFFIILAMYLIFFVLWILLVRFQPLKSRGISPLLTLLFLILQLSLEARNLFTIPIFQGSLCLYYGYGAFPLLELNFIVVFIYFLRYFSIINLNEAKNQFYRTEGKVDTLHWRIKLLKYFSSIYFILIFTFVTLLIILTIFTIVLAIDSFVCKFNTLIALSTINNIELVIIYSLTLILFVIDIIINYKYTILSCRWIQYIIYNDPHYFRIQIVLFIPFMIFSLAFELYKFFTSFTFADIVINFNSTLTMNTIMVSLLFIIDVFFPIIITFIQLMRSLCRKKYRKDKLMETLNVPGLEILFIQFCEQEFSLENILAWKDIQTFKKTRGIDLNEFYMKYLNRNDSVMELNCPRSICDEIFRKMNIHQPVEDNIFDKLEETIYGNLSETFSRFLITKPYKIYIKSKETKLELLEN